MVVIEPVSSVWEAGSELGAGSFAMGWHWHSVDDKVAFC